MNIRIINANRFANTGQIILIICASYYLLAYLAIALIRVSYPFELEWIEGGSVVQVQRILDGQPLYIYPSINFVPFIYTPLYFQISSLVAYVTGNGFFPLRLVSFISSLGCFIFIFLIVYRRTLSRYASFIASCFYAAMFHISGSWFDIARVDSLFLFFLLAGIYAFESPSKFTRNILSPALLFLSFFTKQSALIFAVFLLFGVLITRKRYDRILYPLFFIFLLVGSFALLNTTTEGWYKYYIFDLPSQHAIIRPELIGFWKNDIFQHLPIALIICAVPFLRIGDNANVKSDRVAQDSLIFGGLVITSYLSRIHSGAAENVLMAAYAGIAIYFGIGLSSVFKMIVQNDVIKIIFILLITTQFASLFYPPLQQIPSAMDKQQGERLQQLISGFKGEVYLSGHPWYAQRMNKPSQAQDMAVLDIMRASGSEQWKQKLAQDMINAVSEKRYEAFIVDHKQFILRPRNFDKNYQLIDTNLSGDAFHPVAGSDFRPSFIYVRRTNQQDIQ